MAEDAERERSNDDVSLPRFSRREQIAAAKVRVTVDKRTGTPTPQWIIDLANEEPPPFRRPA